MKKLTILTLFIGLMLVIPNVAGAQYNVQKGDTFYKIAQKHNMSYKDLLLLNPHITNPSLIHPNDFIIIRSKDKAQDLIEYARSLQGQTRYVFGAKYSLSPTQADCSSWTKHIYSKFGVELPRVSREQANVGKPVTFQEMKKGDLMFFSSRADKVITHVGIYMGGDYWISNLNSEKDVTILSTWGSWTQKYFLWAQRVL